MPHVQRQADEWIKMARAAGWRVEMGNGGHAYARLFPLDKRYKPISITATPTGRTRLNERARLRRAGLDV